VRAAGGRAAQRAAAKASASGAAAAPGSGAVLADDETNAEPAGPDEQDADTQYADEGAPSADELTTTASRVPAARGTPGTARPGPRQQPRRGGSTARHRPGGKRKRR
jgi:hypothetical protein